MSVTSYDVAKKAGVSQASVSRVLNSNPQVSPQIRDRVLKALEELNFVPNASAKSMRTSRADTIGVVTAEMVNPYFPQLLDALTKEAHAHDLNVILWNDTAPNAPMAQAGVASGVVDGVIFSAPREHTSGVDILAKRGVPTVLVNRGWADISVDQVTSDHEASGYDAADYFIKHDRRHLATIFGPRDTFASPARESGFRRRLEQDGIVVPDERWLVGETTYEHGRAAAQRILEADRLPDAVFCSADVIAFGAISTFRAAGIRIPDDLWIMGNDDLAISAWDPFDLTTHRQPMEMIAKRGIARLIARMSGETGEPLRELLPTDLIVRGSTAHRN